MRPPPPPASALRPAPPAASARVLVVDDAPWVRERLVQRLLEQPALIVEAAGSRQEALRRLAPAAVAPAAVVPAAVVPAAVVIDLSLPDGNGLEVLAAARALEPRPLCVVLTMSADPETRRACLERGADHFFGKATHFEEAIAVVLAHVAEPAARRGSPSAASPGSGPGPLGADPAEEDLRQRLLLGEKLAAVGRMTASVAHDFNNMLLVIRACAELVRDELAPDSPALDDADNIIATTRRAAALCRELLAFSSGARTEPALLDPLGVLGDCEAMLRALVGRRAELRLELLSDTPAVRMSAIELQQALMNLVVNAVNALDGRGGTVTVRSGLVEVAQRQRGDWGSVPEGRWACIEVSDDGPGIAPELLGQIFEPFFTTGGGTGLGLSTVYRVVHQAGGRVVVHSRPGQGSRFRLFLPSQAPVEPARSLPPRREADGG